MKVSPTAFKACKAIFIIAIVVIGSPIVKEYDLQLRDKLLKEPTKIMEN